MRLHEFTTQLKTYIARVKLSSGATVTATERTESLNYARQIFQHKYGKNNVFSVTEQGNELDEATATKTPQQLQVQSLADQEAKLKQQKKQLVARQALAKAQEKMRQANQASINETL